MCFYLLHDKLFFSLRTFINGRENKQTNKWANQRTATPATKRPRIKQNSAKNSQPVLAMALLIIRAIWIEYNLFDCVCCDCGFVVLKIFTWGFERGGERMVWVWKEFSVIPREKYKMYWTRVWGHKGFEQCFISCRQLAGLKLKWINRKPSHPLARSSSFIQSHTHAYTETATKVSNSFQFKFAAIFVLCVLCYVCCTVLSSVLCEIH